MNIPSEFSIQLEREGAPASPESLDLKILKYSREQAPQKMGFRSNTWLSAVAACSVMGIALLVVLRAPDETLLLDETSLEEAMSLDDMRPFKVEMMNAPAKSPVAKGAVYEEVLSGGHVAAPENKSEFRSKAVQTQSEADLIAEKIVVEEGIAAEENVALQQEKTARRKSQASGSRLEATASGQQPAPANSPALPAANYFDESQLSDLAKDDGIAAGKLAPQTGSGAQGPAPEMATVTTSSYLWEESPTPHRDNGSLNIDETLKKIKALVDKGEQTKAEDEYRILLRECEDCQLP